MKQKNTICEILPGQLALEELKSLLQQYSTSLKGLSESQAGKQRARYGWNQVIQSEQGRLIKEILSKIGSPLVITLLIVAAFSFFFGQRINAIIIIVMALMGVILSLIQEYKAQVNSKKLQSLVRVLASVRREGKLKRILLKEIVPGDIVELSAGNLVPADLRVIEAKELFINQAALTGESFPVEKFAAEIKAKSVSADGGAYGSCTMAFMGSSVVSGTAIGLIMATGKQTQFGKLNEKIASTEPETAFDRGIRQFTWLMIKLIFVLMFFIFISNTLLKGNFIESLLFALAVAVGLTPEMLPMIVTVNLSNGALKMAKKMLIIKRLDSIQNFGAMDILCTDKTGTLTLNEIVLVKHCDLEGKEDETILRDAYLNSSLQTGLANLLDQAVIKHHRFNSRGYRKIDEIPFDFVRRIMTIVVRHAGRDRIITKGAPEEIFRRCHYYELDGHKYQLTPAKMKVLKDRYNEFSGEGFRVLAVAYREPAENKNNYSIEDVEELVFHGFIAFLDPPKPGVKKAILYLESLGIKLKIISGDNELVTRKICAEVGIDGLNSLTGAEVEKMNEAELKLAVEKTTIFARMEPLLKERVIEALRANGHVVGFLGDGINDAPAIKGADVGISVDNAADIARETADIILLKKNLQVLGDCVKEGRKTFANTLKYIKMGASSNFGNMLSMTGASLFLPFLPMLPAQVLLNNFLYDLSQITIPSDNVDEDYLLKPRPWNIKFIKEFIVYIGPISSIFDFATFGVMWYIFAASPALFRTGWFVESLFTQTLIIFIIRTNHLPLLQSRPSRWVAASILGIVALGCWLPFSPLAHWFQFVPLPPLFFLILLLIGLFYLLLAEVIKRLFIRKFGYD